MSYQDLVAAFYSVAILAGTAATPPHDLPANVTLEYLRCETREATDDILVGTSSGGHIFGQAKRKLSLSQKPDSDFASTLDQFARQYSNLKDGDESIRPWNKRLDATLDRLVLVTTPETSLPIRRDFANVLGGVRGLSPNQSISDAATNEDEKKALRIAIAHIKRAWSAHRKSSPSDHDIRSILSLTYVYVLSLERDETDETTALDRLRTSILQSPDHSIAAWNTLVTNATRLAKTRTGADKVKLQQILQQAGIPIRHAADFSDDINNIKKYTMVSTRVLARLAETRVGADTFHIRRPSSLALATKVTDGHVLVVGEPGAGKSAALYDLTQFDNVLSSDKVVLLADRLSSKLTLRSQFGIQHDLVELLTNWHGTEPAYLIIDALDAARDEDASQNLKQLIHDVVTAGGRWHVIASVRHFDLRYSITYQNLFHGTGHPHFFAPDIPAVSHVYIPLLSDPELGDISQSNSSLGNVIKTASPSLLDLLRTPFNVRLVAEILASNHKSGLDDITSSPITQTQLLERHWRYRVLDEDGKGVWRESTLTKICNRILDDGSLQVDWTLLDSPPETVNDLLSRGILSEWLESPLSPSARMISFSHHQLLDYAISQLLLLKRPESIAEKLRNDQDFLLLARPSLYLAFHHLWFFNREVFWRSLFSIVDDDGISPSASIAGPTTAVELAQLPPDLEPILNRLSDSEIATDKQSRLLRYLVGAVLANLNCVRANNTAWRTLTESLVFNHLTPATYGYIKVLVNLTISEQATELPTPTDWLDPANSAARALLDFAEGVDDSSVLRVAIRAVCRTMAGSLAESRSAIRALLSAERIRERGYIEVPILANEIRTIWGTDPALVADIYIRAFEHDESSNATTSLGYSTVVPTTSNRSQDYGMGLWQLSELFGDFMDCHPKLGIRVAASVADSYSRSRRYSHQSEPEVQAIRILDREARFRTDYSSIWDYNPSPDNHALAVINKLESWLRQNPFPPANITLEEIFDEFAHSTTSAVIWRRFLLAAAEQTCLIPLAAELCASHVILDSDDTFESVRLFLAHQAANILLDTRGKITDAIIAFGEGEDHDSQSRRAYQLLAAFDETVVTDNIRQYLSRMRQIWPNMSTESPGPGGDENRGGVSWLSNDDVLRLLGVDMAHQPNESLSERIRSLSSIPDDASGYMGLDAAAIGSFVEYVESTFEYLTELGARDHDTDPSLVARGWSHLANACRALVESHRSDSDIPSEAHIVRILLHASEAAEPFFDEGQAQRFDASPGWGGPAARIEAAVGLMILSQREIIINPMIIEAITRLSNDPVPSVRYQVSRYLDSLIATAPATMWDIAEKFAREEGNFGVLSGLLSALVSRCFARNPARTIDILLVLWERRSEREKHRVLDDIISFFQQLYLYHGDARGRRVVDVALSEISQRPSCVHAALSPLRKAMVYDGPSDDGPSDDGAEVRARAFHGMREILHTCTSAVAANRGKDDDGPAEVNRLVSAVCTEFYFASGAFAEMKVGGNTPLPRHVRIRFYQESQEIFDSILAAATSARTIHYCIEMLESFVLIDPRGVLHRLRHVVQQGTSVGYQLDSMGVDLVVKIAASYLASQRGLLRAHAECREALLEILDSFVEAGSPKALALVYHLEDVFR